MSYTHLTTTERVKIETYLELGMSIRSIARRLGRQPSTVSREIRRNPDYVAERAQKRYEKAKTNCGAKTKLADALAKINGRPRKCLNWKAAHEVFTEEVLRLI